MKLQKTNSTKTMLTISIGFLVVYMVGQWNWALMVSLFIGLIGIFSVFLSKKVEWIWMQLTRILSLIVPNILLGLIFYLILFPVAILSRIFGKKDILQFKRGKSTYYVETQKQFKKEDFIYPW